MLDVKAGESVVTSHKCLHTHIRALSPRQPAPCAAIRSHRLGLCVASSSSVFHALNWMIIFINSSMHLWMCKEVGPEYRKIFSFASRKRMSCVHSFHA